MNLSWVQFGSLMMFLAVVMGAFGSHALRGKISDEYLSVYKTGVLYHFIHGLSLFIVAWLTTQSNDPQVQYAGLFFVLGIFLFSGSLYLLSITEIKWLGAITPMGGVSFLIGWYLLMHATYKSFY